MRLCERLPFSSLGKGWRLLAALLIVLVVPQLAGRLAGQVSPFFSSLDPENAFAWLSTHHVIQLLLTIGAMWLWSSGSLKEWGFNLSEAKVSLRWFGWFALYCTLGMLFFGIAPMILFRHLPHLNFSLNARNVTGVLGFHYLLSGSCEEPLFRGVVMVILLKFWTGEVRLGKVGMPVAGLWATLLFMLAHINFTLVPFQITHFSVAQQLFCLGFGLFYAAAFYRTGSLLCPVLAHGFSNGIIWTLIYLAIVVTPAQASPKSLAGEASMNPNPPISGQEVTFTYRTANGPLAGSTRISLHYGFDGWKQTTDAPMAGAEGVWTLTLKVPSDVCTIDFVFTDGVLWDNNNRQDWHARTQNTQGP